MEEVRFLPPSSFERVPAKPSEKAKQMDFVYEENIHEQADLLKKQLKLMGRGIQLKETGSDDGENARSVSATALEVQYLREELLKALLKEKQAVHRALRTHREFQLATVHKSNEEIKEWLTDKNFDVAKRFNRLLCRLKKKRNDMMEADEDVNLLNSILKNDSERAWHGEYDERCGVLEYEISNMKVKVEAARVLYHRYKNIANLLKQEQLAYQPMLYSLEIQYAAKKREFLECVQYLKEAKGFKERALKALKKTEYAMREKRLQRRKHHAKVQAAIRAIIQSQNGSMLQNMHGKHGFILGGTPSSTSMVASDVNVTHIETIDIMSILAQVHSYQDKTARLLDGMRVAHISQAPQRLRELAETSAVLEEEEMAKEQERNRLIKERDELTLIHNFLASTGRKEFEDTNAEKAKMEAVIAKVEKEIATIKLKAQRLAEIYFQVRLPLIQIITKLAPGFPSGRSDPIVIQVPYLFRTAYAKISKLIAEIKSLQGKIARTGYVSDPVQEHGFQLYASRLDVLPGRFVRVASMEGEPGANDAEDFDGEEINRFEVPSRLDIKVRNKKVENIGRLKILYKTFDLGERT